MKRITEAGKRLYADSLYRNSLFLMASTVIMAGFGMLFWLVNARLYSPYNVGIATTMISVISLVSSISLMGMGGALVKFLPKSERKNDKINTAFTLVILMSVICGLVFVAGVDKFSPALSPIVSGGWMGLLFIGFGVICAVNSLAEGVFVAHRESLYVLIKNTVFSIIKVTFPAILVGWGAYGIFGSFILGMAVSMIVELVIMVKKYRYFWAPQLHWGIIKNMGRFSGMNYLSGLLYSAPTFILPMIITNRISPQMSAYFYIDMMIATLLYTVPSATSQSLFAEGSHNETEIKDHLNKAIGIVSLIMIPGILAVLALGNPVLSIFGAKYAQEGTNLLNLLAFSGIFVAFNSISSAYNMVKKQVGKVVIANMVFAVVTLSLSSILTHQGLAGIGVAWIVGQMVASGVYAIQMFHSRGGTRGY